MRSRALAVEATRERILAAAREQFVASWYDEVTLAAIAAAAGVSHQTLLNHFESKEGLFRAVIEAARPEVDVNRRRAVPGDATSTARTLVDDYERYGDANARMEAQEDRLEVIGAPIREARAYHQDWLARHFAEQLPADRRERRRVLAALHVATDVRTWHLLRRRLGLSRADTVTTMSNLITAALAGAPTTTEDQP
jgi:AcrR family transcriptional regulator